MLNFKNFTILLIVLSVLGSQGCSKAIEDSISSGTVTASESNIEKPKPSDSKKVETQIGEIKAEQAITQNQAKGETSEKAPTVVKTEASETPAVPSSPVSPEKAKEAEGIYEQGFQVYMSGKYDEAIKYFDRAISIDPMCYKAYNGKGIALCFKGQYGAGMKLINTALEIKPDFPYSNFNKAMAFKLQKNYDNALVWFDKTISYDPNDTWSYYGIATIYADRNNTQKALEYLKKAIELDPSVKEVAKSQSHFDNMRTSPEFIQLVK